MLKNKYTHALRLLTSTSFTVGRDNFRIPSHMKFWREGKKKTKDIGDCHLTHVKLLSGDFDSYILSHG